MIRKYLLCVLLSIAFYASAQIRQELDLSSETAIGNGSYTASYLSSNRHGVLSSRVNTGYMRTAYKAENKKDNYSISGGIDLQMSVRPLETSFYYLQQLYLQAQWKWIDFRIGSKEISPLLRDQTISSGSTIWSGNARPIPSVYIGTNKFVTIPGTHNWLQFYLDVSYGYYMDTDYLEDQYAAYSAGKTGYGRSFLTTNIWSHQKRIAFRTCTDRPFIFTLSCEHAVQFGGKSINYIDETLTGDFSPHFKDFFRVLLPLHGDETSVSGDKAFVYGNQLGNISILLEYQWDKENSKKIGFYCENLFDDGSGIRKGNGFDGLWGIEYHTKNTRSLVKGVVIEYLQTTDQSGPIHWAPGDFEGQAIANVAHQATGADNYYNNYFYNGYSYYGQAIGSPMLKAPAYNDDHYLCFTDNRIMAWHLGINGTLWHNANNNTEAIGYKLLASHRRSWGTYFDPYSSIRISTSALTELSYQSGNWQGAIAYAFDEGDLLGHNHSFDIKVKYHLPF